MFNLSVSLFAQQASGGGGSATVPVPQILSPDGLPSTLPITSADVLMSNAKKLIRKVTSNITSPGFVYGAKGINTYLEKAYTPSIPNQPDFVEMANIVSMANFVFETRNPSDSIQVDVSFLGETGKPIFQGSRVFKLVQNPDGNFSPPTPNINVSVYPYAGNLPLAIAGADWVEYALLDSQGQTVGYPKLLERDQSGLFQFPVYLSGQKDVQVIAHKNRDDGTTVSATFGAQTGTRQITRTRSILPTASFENVFIPDAGNTVVVNILDEQAAKILRNGVSPLVQIRFEKQQTLFFYAELPQEIANGFWIRRSDQTGWAYFPIVKGKLTEIPLGAGVYDIVIDWPTFGKRQQSFSNDGGKG